MLVKRLEIQLFQLKYKSLLKSIVDLTHRRARPRTYTSFLHFAVFDFNIAIMLLGSQQSRGPT